MKVSDQETVELLITVENLVNYTQKFSTKPKNKINCQYQNYFVQIIMKSINFQMILI